MNETGSSQEYRPRVPNWVRLSAITMGHYSPWRETGIFFYERLLETATKKLFASLPLREIFVRGSRPKKSFQPGLSDIDLILVANENSRSQVKAFVHHAREIVSDLRKGWHPLGEVSWIQESEKEALFDVSEKCANVFGSRSFRSGSWHDRAIEFTFSPSQFEDAFERYYEGFWLWHCGLQKKDPNLFTLSHVRKVWCTTLSFLNECELVSRQVEEFKNGPPSLAMLGDLGALCLLGLNEAMNRLFPEDGKTEIPPVHLPFLDELDWVIAHQKHLHGAYLRKVETSSALSLDTRFPFCFVVPPKEITGQTVTRFLELILKEAVSLKHGFVFPLLTPALARFYMTRLIPRNQNRRYLHGKTNRWVNMPVKDWELLACDWVIHTSALIMANHRVQDMLGCRSLLSRLQSCTRAQNYNLMPQLWITIESQTRLLTMLTE